MNWLEGSAGVPGCVNGAGLGNAPTGDWFFVEYNRHVNPGNYYVSQRAVGMTGSAAGQTWTRSQQSGVAGTGWGSWSADGGMPSGGIGYFWLTTCPGGWKSADGTNGTPDLRGEFIRGVDNYRGADPDSGRAVGSWQGPSVGSFTYQTFGDDGDSQISGSWYSTRQIAINGVATPSSPRSGWTVPQTAWITPSDTRPRNVAMLACMKQ